VLISAIVTAVVALACGVFALISSGQSSGMERDKELVALLVAVNKADRSLFYERWTWVNAHSTQQDPDPKYVDNAVAELDEAAAAYGVDNLKLSDTGEEKLARALFTDGAAQVKAARLENESGHVEGTDYVDWDRLRAALYAFAQKTPDLFDNRVLSANAKAFVEAMGPADESYPVMITEEEPEGDQRRLALKTLSDAADTAADQTDIGPIVLWVLCGLLGAAAIALWLVYFRQGPKWVAETAAAKRSGGQTPTAATTSAAPAPTKSGPTLPWKRGKKVADAEPAAPAPGAAEKKPTAAKPRVPWRTTGDK
jgi:hypothetical protein